MRRACAVLVALLLASPAGAEVGIEATIPVRGPLALVAELSEAPEAPGSVSWAAGLALEGRDLGATAGFRGERGEDTALELAVTRALASDLTLSVRAQDDGADRQLGFVFSWSF